jgi:hypothetical protein
MNRALPHGDEVPLGRTGFLISRELTSAESAFLAAAALYAQYAVVTQGPAAIHSQILRLIDQHGLGHIRCRVLDAARSVLPEKYYQDTWDRLSARD